jgi:hypothetical protein
MFANGDVLPCELLIDRKLGNVRDVGYDFKKVWYSKEADEARRFIRDTKCFCTYECFLTVNILFNPRMMPKILKEWGSLKVRRYLRKLTGQERPASVISGANGHACMNGAIQDHNTQVLNGSTHPADAANGAAKPSSETHTSAPQ